MTTGVFNDYSWGIKQLQQVWVIDVLTANDAAKAT